MTVSTKKRCAECRETKTLSEFSASKSWDDGHHPYCRQCRSHQAWVRRLRKYGLSAEEYYELLKTQKYVCALCGRGDVRLVIDHDHDTGAVRGILCVRCNSAIALLDFDPKWAVRALDYLELEMEVEVGKN